MADVFLAYSPLHLFTQGLSLNLEFPGIYFSSADITSRPITSACFMWVLGILILVLMLDHLSSPNLYVFTQQIFKFLPRKTRRKAKHTAKPTV